jgi:abortive infection bacteriophage resistance protein
MELKNTAECHGQNCYSYDRNSQGALVSSYIALKLLNIVELIIVSIIFKNTLRFSFCRREAYKTASSIESSGNKTKSKISSKFSPKFSRQPKKTKKIMYQTSHNEGEYNLLKVI